LIKYIILQSQLHNFLPKKYGIRVRIWIPKQKKRHVFLSYCYKIIFCRMTKKIIKQNVIFRVHNMSNYFYFVNLGFPNQVNINTFMLLFPQLYDGQVHCIIGITIFIVTSQNYNFLDINLKAIGSDFDNFNLL